MSSDLFCRSRLLYMCLVRRLSMCLVFTLVAPVAFAAKTIKFNFNSTAGYTESCGTTGTASASSLTAAQKAAVIAVAQKEYDDALGAGQVTISEGSGGDVDIIIDGGNAPGGLNGKEYGDAGKPTKPGVVHEKEFLDRGFLDSGLTNAIGETAAHEAGHKLGLDHNHDNPPSKMTEGSDDSMTIDVRKADGRSFNADDKRKLMTNLGIPKGESKDTTWTTDLGVFIGNRTIGSKNTPDDLFINGTATFLSGPSGTQFGLRTISNFFLFKGDDSNTVGNSTPWTFVYTAGVDVVFFQNGIFYTLADGSATYTLSSPNPNNPGIFGTADITVNTASGPATLEINLETASNTGGFWANICTGGLGDINIVPVIGAAGVFCLNNYGASDTLFWGTPPPAYDQSLDVLSGDSAANLRFNINGVLASGKGWLTHYMDAGMLIPSYTTGSNYQVITPTRYVGNNLSIAQSEIFDPGTGAFVQITTRADDPNQVGQSFTISNFGPQALQSVWFSDYGNYHPNGSLPGDVNNGTVNYLGADGYLTTGDPSLPSFVANAEIKGDLPDGAHGAGPASPAGLIHDVETGAYNGLNVFGPGDAAGALVWTLGDLAPGQSTTVRTFVVRMP